MKNKNVLLLLLLLCHNIIHSQQVDINSAHYIGNANFTLFEDVFNTSGRTWDANSYIESEGNWRAHFKGSITHGANEHQAYQRSQAVFDENNEMLLLIADYVSDTDLECDDLEHPNGTTCKIDSSYSIRYLSGAIQSIDPSFLYGYFEIRCKLPVHQGAFPAFWLFSACNKSDCEDPYYEELDIFEYSWNFTDSVKYGKTEAMYVGDNRCFTSGLYINDTGNAVSWRDAAARKYPRISDDKPGVEQWNTWGCLWMPDKVEWYVNGEMINSYYDDLILEVLFYDDVCTPTGKISKYNQLTSKEERKQFLKENTEITHMALVFAPNGKTRALLAIKGELNYKEARIKDCGIDLLSPKFSDFQNLRLADINEVDNNDLKQFLQEKIDLDKENMEKLSSQIIRGDLYEIFKNGDDFYIRYICRSTGRIYYNRLNLRNLEISKYFDRNVFDSYARAWWNLNTLGSNPDGDSVIRC